MPLNINGVISSEIKTITDATAIASDLRIGKTAYVNNNQKITGTGILLNQENTKIFPILLESDSYLPGDAIEVMDMKDDEGYSVKYDDFTNRNMFETENYVTYVNGNIYVKNSKIIVVGFMVISNYMECRASFLNQNNHLATMYSLDIPYISYPSRDKISIVQLDDERFLCTYIPNSIDETLSMFIIKIKEISNRLNISVGPSLNAIDKYDIDQSFGTNSPEIIRQSENDFLVLIRTNSDINCYASLTINDTTITLNRSTMMYSEVVLCAGITNDTIFQYYCYNHDLFFRTLSWNKSNGIVTVSKTEKIPFEISIDSYKMCGKPSQFCTFLDGKYISLTTTDSEYNSMPNYTYQYLIIYNPNEKSAKVIYNFSDELEHDANIFNSRRSILFSSKSGYIFVMGETNYDGINKYRIFIFKESKNGNYKYICSKEPIEFVQTDTDDDGLDGIWSVFMNDTDSSLYVLGFFNNYSKPKLLFGTNLCRPYPLGRHVIEKFDCIFKDTLYEETIGEAIFFD